MEATKPADTLPPSLDSARRANRLHKFLKSVWKWAKRVLKWLAMTVLSIVVIIMMTIFTRNHIVHGGLFNKNQPIDHIVLIVVDGLRTDEVTPELAPNIYSLARTGAYSLKALTDTPASTPVAHMSLFTGLGSKTHGVNGYFKWRQMLKAYLWRTSIFDYMHENGFETEVLLGWPDKKLNHDEERSLRLLTLGFYFKGVDRMTFYVKSPMAKSERAFEILNTDKPTFMFLHFLENDAAGHRFGWMTKEQLKELVYIDEAIGQLKKNLARSGLLDRTLIVLTSDHGGLNKSHGSCTDILCRRIPIIIAGPGVKKNYRMADEQHIYDITPTILKLLGDGDKRNFEGRPIPEIYSN